VSPATLLVRERPTRPWQTRLVAVALAFTAGCGSGAPPAAPAEAPKAEAKGKKAPPAESKSVETRADEIIADLKKRQDEQVGIQQKAGGSEARRLQQQFALASARLQTSLKRLDDARRRLNETEQQREGQPAYEKALLEFSRAQQAYDQDQSAVNRARSAALAAGVPASSLR
jgi:hypothetical protein